MPDVRSAAGQFLYEKRKRSKLTQQEVNQKLPKPFANSGTISHIERGYKLIKLSKADDFVTAYGLDADEKTEFWRLLTEQKRSAVTGKTEENNPPEALLFYRLVQLPKDVRNRIIKAVKVWEESEE